MAKWTLWTGLHTEADYPGYAPVEAPEDALASSNGSVVFPECTGPADCVVTRVLCEDGAGRRSRSIKHPAGGLVITRGARPTIVRGSV
jgi:hypothetical protein